MKRRTAAPCRETCVAGTSLVELLVAIALLGLALATMAMLATAVLAGFEADPAAADEQQRARSGINVLVDDVFQAGSGFIQAPDDAPGGGLPALAPDTVTVGGWVMRALPDTLTTVAGRRGAAHARLRASAAAGDLWLRLERPAFCTAILVTCGFARGGELLIFDRHGRFAVAEIAQVTPPLDLELVSPLAEGWLAGASVSSVVMHTYAARNDPATGLLQLVRRVSAGPGNPVIDFVTRFEVEWHTGGSPPFVRVAPDGTFEDASAGPRPPPAAALADPAWPAGENCAFARDAAGMAVWRGGTGTAALAAFADGPWCPAAMAPSRWDLDLARVTRVTVRLGVAVASALLRPPTSLLARVPGGRVVPDLTLQADIIPGRRNGGG
ncbi:MAG TPA: hypothetical protein VMW48_20945 [Vicinamibacterales bacterium]|nr:hypothetical protein [Vicinamibacterales bacterium]